ncbi:MAG TPA: trypsin-like peptidase domain-containing protein [Propionibacteriaceae bacterium]|nr:trypsin-like peptidase domain-containing protein [Propionibacteriaceae bacterium]
MNTSDNAAGPYVPPDQWPDDQPSGDVATTAGDARHPGPQFLPDGRVAGYSAADFPGPPGVPPLLDHGVDRSGSGSDFGPASVATAPPAAPKRRLGTSLAAAALAAVIGAGAGIGSYAYVAGGAGGSGTVPSIGVTSAPAANSPALDGTIAAAAAAIAPSVVTITVQSGPSGGVGTGVVLDADGHILTNNHVVDSAGRQGSITVTFRDGTTADATLVGTSPTNDLAVIKVPGSKTLKPATFARSGSVEVGQSVIAAGAPLGLSQTITSGIVSNTARPVRSGSDNDAVYLAVQTDAAINPGNSGGPLVNLNGDVIGINSSIASTGSSEASQSGNIGIGFAIPADVATRIAADLIRSGTSVNAALGVTVGGTDSELSTARGVELNTVVAGGAADKAGLRAGDQVTKLNDFATTTADGLIAATRFYAPGTEVTVGYLRDGEPATARVTLGSS